MHIRTAQLDRDYEAVLALWRASAPGVHVGRSDTPEALGMKLTRDPDLFLVAEVAGRVVGAVLGGFDGRRGMVYHLAVDAACQHQGIGSALMAELEARLKAKGCVKYFLLVVPENDGALSFYRRLGWEVLPVSLLGKEIR